MAYDKQLDSYAQAMEMDRRTNKPMEKMAIEQTWNMLAEQKTQADSVSGTLTFTEDIMSIEIYNRDTTNDGVFNVNGINITVPKGDIVEYEVAGTPSKTVTVTGSTLYIVSRMV